MGKNNFKNYIITSHFFPHIIAIDINLISQDNSFFEKQGISVIVGFFQEFLALFDTFTIRYSHLGIKFEILIHFGLSNHLNQISILKILKK